MSKIPVSALYEYCEMMLRDHWGYIYGTAGVKCTQKTIDNAIAKFPKYAATTKKYGPQWIGYMVTDCSGVMVYIWRQYGKTIPHGSSSMVKQKYIVDCSDTPRPGYAALVDPTPDTDDNDHIGIVAEDGVTIYEAKGTQYGFTTSTIKDKRWTKYGRFVDVDYECKENGGESVDPMYTAVVNTQSGNLNMRSGPGKTYSSFMSIPKGATVEVIAEYENGWDCVRYNGKIGYVSAEYLKPENNSDPIEIPTETEQYQWMVIIPCESENEARRYAGGIKNAIVLRCEKPPDAIKGE